MRSAGFTASPQGSSEGFNLSLLLGRHINLFSSLQLLRFIQLLKSDNSAVLPPIRAYPTTTCYSYRENHITEDARLDV